MKIYTFFFLFFLPFFLLVFFAFIYFALVQMANKYQVETTSTFFDTSTQTGELKFSVLSFSFHPPKHFSPFSFCFSRVFFFVVLFAVRKKTSVNCCWAKNMVNMDERACGSWPAWQGKGREQFWKLFTSNSKQRLLKMKTERKKVKSAMKTLVQHPLAAIHTARGQSRIVFKRKTFPMAEESEMLSSPWALDVY